MQEKPYGNPHRVYRDRERSVIAGVFAGLATYFGARPVVLRLIAVFLCLFPPLGVLIVFSYLIAAFKLPPMPEKIFENREEERFWRSVSDSPADTFGAVRHQLRDLEHRLRQMEAYVTSAEFDIDREINRA